MSKLAPKGAHDEQSSRVVDVFDDPKTDHTYTIKIPSLSHQIPIVIFEFKGEMGVAGDPIMEAIAYHATHSLNKAILEKTRVPCLLITLSGPVVVVYCGA